MASLSLSFCAVCRNSKTTKEMNWHDRACAQHHRSYVTRTPTNCGTLGETQRAQKRQRSGFMGSRFRPRVLRCPYIMKFCSIYRRVAGIQMLSYSHQHAPSPHLEVMDKGSTMVPIENLIQHSYSSSIPWALLAISY